MGEREGWSVEEGWVRRGGRGGEREEGEGEEGEGEKERGGRERGER